MFINRTEPNFWGTELYILIMQFSSYKNNTDDEQWDLKFQWCAATPIYILSIISRTWKLNKEDRVATINTDNFSLYKWSK